MGGQVLNGSSEQGCRDILAELAPGVEVTDEALRSLVGIVGSHRLEVGDVIWNLQKHLVDILRLQV